MVHVLEDRTAFVLTCSAFVRLHKQFTAIMRVNCLVKGQNPTTAKAPSLSTYVPERDTNATGNDTIRLLTAGLFSKGLDGYLSVNTNA